MLTATLEAIRVGHARSLADALLAGLPQRWLHTVGVARRAQEGSATVDPADRELLICAAWLHDVGYSAALRDTGFHSVDGARYLDRLGWPQRLCALVAHHSGAQFLAGAVGVGVQLAAFDDERSDVSDALIFADQTTGVRGQPMTVPERLTEVLQRHGPESAHGLAHVQRAPYLLDAVERVQARLARSIGKQVHVLA